MLKAATRRVNCVSVGILALAAGWFAGLQVTAQSPAQLDKDFTLKTAASVTLDSKALTVRFDRVAEDSRCPEGARCITSGDATVILTATLRGGQPRRLELHTNEEPATAEIPGFQIALVGLVPKPGVDRPVAQRDYVATLHVKRLT